MTGRVPAAPAPITRLTLADQVRDYIVLEIASGRLIPGAPLRELELAQILGTSQSPVREALRELAALGLVDTQRHVGARVRQFLKQDLVDGVPVRAMLEGFAARLASTAIEGSKAEIVAAFDVLLRVAHTGDRLAYSTANVAFHAAVIAAAGNDSLTRAWRSLGIEVMTILAIAGTEIDLVESAESHRDILTAIEDGDGDRADDVMKAHQAIYLPGTQVPPKKV